GAAARVRNLDLEGAAINLLLAEELVAMNFSVGERRRAERHPRRLGREPELLAIQVVAVDDVESDAQTVRVGRDLVRVGALRTQHVLRDGGAGRGRSGLRLDARIAAAARDAGDAGRREHGGYQQRA